MAMKEELMVVEEMIEKEVVVVIEEEVVVRWWESSLVPRPHPSPTAREGLVTLVHFLRLLKYKCYVTH